MRIYKLLIIIVFLCITMRLPVYGKSGNELSVKFTDSLPAVNLNSGHKIIAGSISDKEGRKYDFPYQDPNLTFEERVNDLVGRLTLEEKISQMLNSSPAIPRLGIPAYNWWNECLHGIGRTSYKVTVFPQAIGMAATFDPFSMEMMGDFTSEEGRAIYNESIRRGIHDIYLGLTYWTPNINIFRDPRWGRGQETYGEDPYLTGIIGKAFVKGLQGNNSKYMKAAACAKHYAIHSGPEPSRHHFNAEITNYDLWDTYLPAFRELVVNANVAGVMCAYNAYKKQPCCGNDLLMTNILRDKWHFGGYVTSDCGGINDFYQGLKVSPDPQSAAANAVLHGTDLNCGETYAALNEAVLKGFITEAKIDESVKRLFFIRFRLGMFDPAEMVPYTNIHISILESDSHKALALHMAHESVVLLKNEKQTLPLTKKLKKIAILGPNADNETTLLGNYNGVPSEIVTPLEGIKAKLGKSAQIVYSPAMGLTSMSDTIALEPLLERIRDVDAIIFVGGISPILEGEEMPVNQDGFSGGDRTSVLLPNAQTIFMQKLSKLNKPVIFVMMSGSAVSTPWESEHIPAIMNVWYGGQSAGTAIADIIFGDYNPSGRLPVTIYRNDSDLPAFENYSMENRTYRYFKSKALYPFGFGLSYTNFMYKWASKPGASYSMNDTISFSVQIKNIGKRNGDEVIQAYIKYPEGEKLPIKELKGFQRITINKTQTKTVSIQIPVTSLQKWNEELSIFEVKKGNYQLFVGGSSDDEKLIISFLIN